MPLYDVSCPSCGVREVLARPNTPVPCPSCGGATQRLVSMPARTSASWGDSQGYFDRGLGCYVENSQHRERVMKAKGLAPLSDFAKHAVEDYAESQVNERKEHERVMARLESNMKEHNGDQAAAIAATFPLESL